MRDNKLGVMGVAILTSAAVGYHAIRHPHDGEAHTETHQPTVPGSISLGTVVSTTSADTVSLGVEMVKTVFKKL